MKITHLSIEEKERIKQLYALKTPISHIADAIKRSPAAVSEAIHGTKKKPRTKVQEGFFNVNEREVWL
jgi:IS30 family transposase